VLERRGIEHGGALAQRVEPAAPLVERGAIVGEQLVEPAQVLLQLRGDALVLEPAAQQRARQRLVAGAEAQVELAFELALRDGDLGEPRRALASLQLPGLEPARRLRHFLVHFADGLAQQRVGLLDAVEHGVDVGAEQPRATGDEGHGSRSCGWLPCNWR
jgi:hypothetical protein